MVFTTGSNSGQLASAINHPAAKVIGARVEEITAKNEMLRILVRLEHKWIGHNHEQFNQ